MSNTPITRIKALLKKESLEDFEIIPLASPLSFDQYQNWLKNQQHGEMDYMAKNKEVREKPKQHFEPMQSMIVFTQSYFPYKSKDNFPLKNLKIAHYAKDEDYHIWFRQKLNELIKKLKEEFPDESFLSFTDAVPLLERDHGAQASLGWVGKNTCLIHPKKGSLFFIGEILCSLPHNTTPEPMHDFCGNCTACIDECPTGAIVSPKVLDAKKCLAYWNIESREVPPVEIREKMDAWFFGCDICQTVCPWNIKWNKNHPGFVQKISTPKNQEEELKMILETSNKKLFKLLKNTPLSRAGGRGLKRNAMIVIANLNLKNLTPQVESYLNHETLANLAQWTLTQLKK